MPIIRAFLGAGVAIGLYALVAKALGNPALSFASSWPQIGGAKGATTTTIAQLPYVLGAFIGIAYGVFVEVDDGGKADKKPE